MNETLKVTCITSFSHFITHGYMTLLASVLAVIASQNSMGFYEIGLVANIGYFLYGLGSFPAGYLADRFGSKRILSLGVLGLALSSILIGFSSSLLSFGITYALLGLFASIHHPAGLSLIARRIHTKKGQALGVHGIFGNVGLIITPLVGVYCVHLSGSWHTAYFLYGAIGLIFFLFLCFTHIENEPDLTFKNVFKKWRNSPQNMQVHETPEKPASPPIMNTGKEPAHGLAVFPIALLVLYGGSILSGFIFRGSLTFFPTLLQREVSFITNSEEPVVMAGFVTSGILSLGLLGAWFGGFINDKIKTPELYPVIIFLIVTPVLYLISRLTDSYLLAASAVFSLVYYSWQPSQNYLISKYSRKTSHGKSFGVNFFLLFGIGSIATAIGGYISDNYGVDLFYLIMGMVSLAACLTAGTVLLTKKYRLRLAYNIVKDADE